MEQSYGIPEYKTSSPAIRVLSDRIIQSSKRSTFKGVATDGSVMPTTTVRRGGAPASLANLVAGSSGARSMSYAVRLTVRKKVSIFKQGCVESRSTNRKTGEIRWLRACFITLTIPGLEEVIDSKKGYHKLIKKFMRHVMHRWGVVRYVWRFEWQGRGQGHWHILMDRYVPQERAAAKWWELVKGIGLTESFEKRYAYTPASCCYVKGIKSESHLDRYLWQYFDKEDQSKKPTNGRWWGASECIRKSATMILPVVEGWDRHVECLRRAGIVDIIDVDIERAAPIGGYPENALRDDSRQGNTFTVCSVIKKKKGKLLDLLMPLQRGLAEQWITAYRSSNWRRTRELAAAFGDHQGRYTRFRELYEHMRHDMEYLESTKEWPSCEVYYKSTIQRANIKKRHELELGASQLALGLFT